MSKEIGQFAPILAVYAGSFDPVTKGHGEVIERAAKLFSKLIVSAGHSSEKATFFTKEERVDMLRECCQGIKNVEIAAHDGLTVDYATKIGAGVLVLGIPSGADYTYEMAMAQEEMATSRKLNATI